MTEGTDGASVPPGTGAQTALRIWRDGLVNLTGRNRALNFRHAKSSTVAIQSPALQTILDGLVAGSEWSFAGKPDRDRLVVDEDDLGEDDDWDADEDSWDARDVRAVTGPTLRCDKPERDLAAALRNLSRKATQEYLDRGLSVMYVGLGMLRWRDVDGTGYVSPLLLVPVEFVSAGAKATPRLKVGEDDPTVNPALALRMQDFEVALPTVEDLTGVTVDGLLARVRSAVSGRAGWRVTEEAVLAAFSFQKEAMYRDLLANEDAILAHPLVRALANQDPTSQDGSLLFDPISGEDIDRLAPPETAPLVLDADSSQRACVAAAVAGHSFVMDGPPGTGKSQTIANMIGALLHAGKSVLFVSEKAAALEVVKNRLAEAGLENYLLELHSHKASRKEVAHQLATGLDTVPVPPEGMDAGQRRKAADHRATLNAYADAMNRVRQPLGFSLHHVLGQVSALNHVPAAPTPDHAPVDLDGDALADIADAAARLARAWRPATQGRSFLWRDATDRGPLDSRLYQAETALEELAGVADHNLDLRYAFDLHAIGDLAILEEFLRCHTTRPPGVHDAWLSAEDFAAVRGAADHLSGALATIREATEHARALAGVDWDDLPDPAGLPASPDLTHLSPTAVAPTDLTAAEATEVADRFTVSADLLDQRLTAVAGLARALGLPAPGTVHEIDSVLTVADAAYAPHRPERAWLTLDGLQAAREAADVLRRRVHDLATAETAAHRLFTDAALTQPLSDLHERFTTVHKGLRKLFGDYRRDKKTVAAFTAEMVTLEDAIADLGLAVSWSQATTALTDAEQAHATVLGSYWQGRDTDFGAIDEALAVAEEVLRHAPTDALGPVTDHVTATTPETALKSLIEQTRTDLGRWRSSLAPPPAPSGRPDLLLAPLAEAVTWLRAHVAPMRDAAARTRAVDDATGNALTLADADARVAARRAVTDATAALAGYHDWYEDLLGPVFEGQDTDEDAVATALAWAEQVRAVRHGRDRALTESQVKVLHAARPTSNLTAARERWQAASERIVTAFGPSRHRELRGEFDTFDSALSLLADLRDDTSGQEEWFAYRDARDDLAAHHLDGVVEFCIDQAVPAESVLDVVKRALLRSWADHVVQADRDLRPIRAEDRAALIEQYRDLDRRLIPAATSEIIRKVNTRRPASTDVGEPALIRREGVKKTRHAPVRDLIARTRNTTLAIKPCFMMSPLAVSQYLPADMRFDVVIFDEASQVTPGDAINCIYRGKALITAGDDRQLPPTSFFDRVSDEEDEDTDVQDFQSILELAKASGAFRNLGLRWHYRSRHEDLIAFSNHRFYEGKLVTYPGAHSHGPDVGVELFPVAGQYRRGTSRDNPIEAKKVADRVVHHFDTRPDTSLGVVTFSVAQADAIQTALDRVLEDRPDLARHFEEDRLHGFFIKSLESVQGDERDVMIFSLGYGPDEHGKVTANFGALNKPKGWRRLNVAITRARQRVEIVSSLRAGTVPATTNESVLHLAGYLDYAERGTEALGLDLGPSGRGTDSPFEDSVIDVIRAHGYTVEPQVGAAGYRIDIGVRHPAHPGVYAIGIECDGYMYHSSPAARDRDRLREQVLVGLGWRLHRIWGTAWYRHRPDEERRLIAAIEEAVDAPVTGRLSGVTDPFERAKVEVEVVDPDQPPPWTTPYHEAAIPPLPRWADPADSDAVYEMVPGIETLAREEGPIHIDLVLQRLRTGWDIGRVSARIRENINDAIILAEVDYTDDFLDSTTRTWAPVRVPAGGRGRRTVNQIADYELEAALTRLLEDAGVVDLEDLLTATARIFGWNRRSAQITARLTSVAAGMHARGVIGADGDDVHLKRNE